MVLFPKDVWVLFPKDVWVSCLLPMLSPISLSRVQATCKYLRMIVQQHFNCPIKEWKRHVLSIDRLKEKRQNVIVCEACTFVKSIRKPFSFLIGITGHFDLLKLVLRTAWTFDHWDYALYVCQKQTKTVG